MVTGPTTTSKLVTATTTAIDQRRRGLACMNVRMSNVVFFCTPCSKMRPFVDLVSVMNEMNSLQRKSIELSVRGRVSPKSSSSRRRVDFPGEVTSLYAYTVRPVRVSHPTNRDDENVMSYDSVMVAMYT